MNEAGRSRSAEPHANAAAVAAVVPQADLRKAIDADELVLHYQPIVDLSTGQPVGAEALVRWQHPTGGLLLPDDFVPAVANTPVITALTRWVVQAACAAATDWPDWKVAVNITARDLVGDDLVNCVAAALADAHMPAERLALELTETSLIQDLDRAAMTLGKMREIGVSIALDDFGTGYSSMLYLRDLPVTGIKIDREFIAGVADGGDDRAIVASLLTLARATGLTTAAEGVESTDQSFVLRSMGCGLGQGYLWSRPQPAATMDAIYRDGLPDPSRRARRPKSRPHESSETHVVEQVRILVSQGASLHTIAAALNAAGERTSSGTRWHSASVARLISSHISATH